MSLFWCLIRSIGSHQIFPSLFLDYFLNYLSYHLTTYWIFFPHSTDTFFLLSYLTIEIMISLRSRDSHQKHTIHLLTQSIPDLFFSSFTHSFIHCPSIFSMTIIIIFLWISLFLTLSHPYLISYHHYWNPVTKRSFRSRSGWSTIPSGQQSSSTLYFTLQPLQTPPLLVPLFLSLSLLPFLITLLEPLPICSLFSLLLNFSWWNQGFRLYTSSDEMSEGKIKKGTNVE